MEQLRTSQPGGAAAPAIFPNPNNPQLGVGKQTLLANDGDTQEGDDIEQGGVPPRGNTQIPSPVVGARSVPDGGAATVAGNNEGHTSFRWRKFLDLVSLKGENKMAFPDTADCSFEFARACFAEFWATALFVFIGTGSVAATGEFLVLEQPSSISASVSRILPIATAFGIAITVMIFSIGHVSGGHINPAVTLGLFLTRRLTGMRALCYMFCQFAGAVLGSAFLLGCLSGLPSSVPIVITSRNGQNQTTIDRRVGYPPFFLGANQLNSRLSVGNGLFFETLGTSLIHVGREPNRNNTQLHYGKKWRNSHATCFRNHGGGILLVYAFVTNFGNAYRLNYRNAYRLNYRNAYRLYYRNAYWVNSSFASWMNYPLAYRVNYPFAYWVNYPFAYQVYYQSHCV